MKGWSGGLCGVVGLGSLLLCTPVLPQTVEHCSFAARAILEEATAEVEGECTVLPGGHQRLPLTLFLFGRSGIRVLSLETGDGDPLLAAASCGIGSDRCDWTIDLGRHAGERRVTVRFGYVVDRAVTRPSDGRLHLRVPVLSLGWLPEGGGEVFSGRLEVDDANWTLTSSVPRNEGERRDEDPAIWSWSLPALPSALDLRLSRQTGGRWLPGPEVVADLAVLLVFAGLGALGAWRARSLLAGAAR